MSWFRAAPEIPVPGDQDVFDEEADETLLVQREWQGHMRKRVQVNGRDPGRAGKGTPTWDTGSQGQGHADGSRAGGVRLSHRACTNGAAVLGFPGCLLITFKQARSS